MHNFSWGLPARYNDFQTAFRKHFNGQKLQKISVDPGFTCPNRDGARGKGGCTYCNNASFSPGFASMKKPVTEQIEEGIRFFAHKYQGMHYLAYFQSYTNTYAPLQQLQDLYAEALRYPGIEGLVLATRPDCVNDEILDYLAEVAASKYVMLEFGVESHLDRTLEGINRGHTCAESVAAIRAAAERGIHTTAHLILGFQGESYSDWMEQADFISQLPVENLKLHQLQIHKNTVMAYQYKKDPGSFRLFEAEEYATLVVDYLERLSPRITVERFTSQAPAELLIAPSWGIKNYVFTDKVNKLLKERDTWQGRRYSGH